MHTDLPSPSCTAFVGDRLLMSGSSVEVALAIRAAADGGETGTILAFDDATGRVIDFDLRGTETEIRERLSSPFAAPRGRGRPKLGVVAREITLLPRHWEWLAAQPGGASVTLRKLVDEARRTGGAKQQRRAAQESAYRFMSAMAGNLPGFEEAARSLFADDRAGFDERVAVWPTDIRDFVAGLAFGRSPEKSCA